MNAPAKKKGQETEPRRAPLALGFSLLCLLVFAWALWVPTLDAIDETFSTRQQVAEHAPVTTIWDLSLHGEAEESPEVQAALGVLSPAYVDFVDRFGAELILSDVASLASVRVAAQNDLMHTAGVYFPEKKVVYISHDTSNPGWTALHELGHLIDHALGLRSGQPGFQAVYRALRDDPRLDVYARSSAQELFAEFFSRYYYSDRRRAHLLERFPDAAAQMARLEAEILRGAQPVPIH